MLSFLAKFFLGDTKSTEKTTINSVEGKDEKYDAGNECERKTFRHVADLDGVAENPSVKKQDYCRNFATGHNYCGENEKVLAVNDYNESEIYISDTSDSDGFDEYDEQLGNYVNSCFNNFCCDSSDNEIGERSYLELHQYYGEDCKYENRVCDFREYYSDENYENVIIQGPNSLDEKEEDFSENDDVEYFYEKGSGEYKNDIESCVKPYFNYFYSSDSETENSEFSEHEWDHGGYNYEEESDVQDENKREEYIRDENYDSVELKNSESEDSEYDNSEYDGSEYDDYDGDEYDFRESDDVFYLRESDGDECDLRKSDENECDQKESDENDFKEFDGGEYDLKGSYDAEYDSRESDDDEYASECSSEDYESDDNTDLKEYYDEYSYNEWVNNVIESDKNDFATNNSTDLSEELVASGTTSGIKENDLHQVFSDFYEQLQDSIALKFSVSKDAVKLAINRLIFNYSNLTRCTTPEELNFSDINMCIGYLHRYGTCHAAMVCCAMIKVIEASTAITNLLDLQKLNLVCLGSGPGNDFIGLVYALILCKVSITGLDVTVVDRSPGWKVIFSAVVEILNDVFCLQTEDDIPSFIGADLVDSSTWNDKMRNKLKRANIVTLVKVLSNISNHDHLETLKNIIRCMKDDALLILIDCPLPLEELNKLHYYLLLVYKSEREKFTFSKKKTRFGYPTIRKCSAYVRVYRKRNSFLHNEL